jgi:proteasome lid subunit RPN8/RPN11
LHELRDRGRGTREAGAFLLGRHEGEHRIVEDFITYDEIDPNCLQGGIMFDGSRMDRVWELCRAKKLQVVADVHTHPGGYGQSGTDRANPMMPERGHIALIIPNFADRIYVPGEIGIYEFLGGERWKNHSAQGPAFFGLRRFA